MPSKSIAIHIKPETWERCKKFGVYGDSQDDLLNRVVDLADKYAPIAPPAAPVVKEPTQDNREVN